MTNGPVAVAASIVLTWSAAQTPAPAATQSSPVPQAQHPGVVRVLAETPEGRATWGPRLARMVRTGALKVREERASLAGPRDQWLEQRYKGVPVVGGEVWRRLDGNELVGAEGTLYEKIGLNPVPKLTRVEARAAVTALVPGSPGPSRPPELWILPTAAGGFALVYRARIYTGADLTTYYLDASTGAVVLSEAESGAPKSTPR